ncbi:S24 family peptidase [Tamlana sp. 2201CG12-4]|uniref:S24 family peptidase n=1 Tax=Tamlana sp. 2201CG12-4 TaxID=3112582 RepID=UPI002DBB93DE|nr:S24 family peptidase [Tamlana sp. 2201CG12-4]MEC3906515.1 S24 family peptidase [Tamlana sp. 2201CG12-4]
MSILESGNRKFIPFKYIEYLIHKGFDINTLFGDSETIKKTPDNTQPNKVFTLRTDTVINNAQAIPLYDIEAVAGLVPLFNDTETKTPIDFIKIPYLPKCDGAIKVTGDSMYPLLKSGDIIMYKQIYDIGNDIFWGEMYLLSVSTEDEEYITVKYIQRSEKGENWVKLVSQNQHHQDRHISRDRIKALALVKASIRINSMS